MVCNSQVPSGASEKDWVHISNFLIFGNSAFCNPISLLTISQFTFIQTLDKGEGSLCPCWLYLAPKDTFFFFEREREALVY